MSFTGNENHDISLDDAKAWTANYRTNNPGAIKAHFFGKAAIQAILDQQDCVGIRIYYAEDGNRNKHLVIVGADANEEDLYNGNLAERSLPCPTFCPNNSPLSK